MGTRVYLAARFGRQAELRAYRDRLIEQGIEVTSSWLDAEFDDGDVTTAALFAAAGKNYEDIEAAHAFIVFTDEQSFTARGGHHVELGYAEGVGKSTILVGPSTNCFHAYVDLHFETVHDFFRDLHLMIEQDRAIEQGG